MLGGWLGAIALMWAARLWMFRQFRLAQPQHLHEWARWRRWWNLGTLCSGALWGTSAWLFYPHGDNVQQTGLIITVYTFCIAAVPVLSTQPRVFLAFAALCFVPMVARIALVGDVYSLQLAGILLLIFSLTTLLARNYRQALQRVIDLKLQADELLQQLRVEKQAADAGAPGGRSGQPRQDPVLHRRQPRPAPAAACDGPVRRGAAPARATMSRWSHLVNSINDSVDALESPVLRAARHHPHRHAAASRCTRSTSRWATSCASCGCTSSRRPSRRAWRCACAAAAHVVHADPLLVERILRNLVSNAIRYTLDGTVLVGCPPPW